MRRTSWGSCVWLVLALAACGGGGGSPDPVTPMPEVQLLPPATLEEAIEQTWSSSAAGLSGLSHVWNFGDGVTSNEPSPRHRYAMPGRYTVKLVVRDGNGRTREVGTTIDVARYQLVAGLGCSGVGQSGWCWMGGARTIGFHVDGQFTAYGNELGEVHTSVDGGQTWQRKLAKPEGGPVLAVHAENSRLLAFTAQGKFWRSEDAGASWASSDAGFALPAPVSAGATSAPTLQVKAGGQRLLLSYVADRYSGRLGAAVSTDGGRTWRQVTHDELELRSGLAFDGNGHLWGVRRWTEVLADGSWRTRYELAGSDDGGATFSARLTLPALGSGLPTIAIAGSHVMVMRAEADGRTYGIRQWLSADSGQHWVESSASGVNWSSDSAGYRLLLDDNGDAWLFHDSEGIYKRSAAGSSWQRVAAANSDYTCRPKRLDAKSLALICDDRVSFSSDNGASWRTLRYGALVGNGSSLRLEVDRNGWWRARDFFAQADGSLTLQYNGSLAQSSDNGANWRRLAGWPLLKQVWMLDRRNGWAYDAEGDLLRTSDGGRSWTLKQRRFVDTTGAPSIRFATLARGWLLTENRALMRTEDGGGTWSPIAGAGQWSFGHYQFFDADRGLAIEASGNELFGSADGGKTWGLVNSRVRPNGVTLNGMIFRNPDLGLAFFYGGLVSRTSDGGKTWQSIVTPSSAALSRGLFLNDNVALAIGVGGTVLRSDDAGRSWSKLAIAGLTDVKHVQSLPDGSRVWLMSGDGKIFVSRDAGMTWQVQQIGGGIAAAFGEGFVLDGRSLWLVDELGRLLVSDSGGD